MKVVFISGPYRSTTKLGISQNIKVARKAAIKLWREGYAVICPHMNTAHFDGICEDSVWLEGDLEIMRRCDAVFFLEGWQESEGARLEHHEALKLHKQILYQVRKIDK